MLHTLNLDLTTPGGQTFARVSSFSMFGGHQTLSGVEFTFDFVIIGTDLVTKTKFVLEGLDLDLSFFSEDQKELYIGRFRRNLDDTRSLTTYSLHFQRSLELSQGSFWKLVDSTHYRDLDFRFIATAVGRDTISNTVERIFLRGDTRVIVPHSDWLKILNNGQFNRFESITIRNQIAATGKTKEIYDTALSRLKDAESSFNRGDWNAVGTKCRAAWGVFKSQTPRKNQSQAVERLMASVTGDPRRKEFGEAFVRGVNEVLNKATHLEGDSSSNTLPVDLRREDALLCLHLTSALLSYLAAISRS